MDICHVAGVALSSCCYTSRIVFAPALPVLVGARCVAGAAAPRRLRLPIRCTRLLPTASTAPRGEISEGVCAAPSWTLNSLMLVLFQTPAVPFATTISAANTNPQSSDSYHPRDKGDHSKRCTLIGEGSIPRISVSRIVVNAAAVSLESPVEGNFGPNSEISMRIVCSGSPESQPSSCVQCQQRPLSVVCTYPWNRWREELVGR